MTAVVFSPMLIRPYTLQDSASTRALFQKTIRTINANDYTAFEIAAWLKEEDTTLAQWHAHLASSLAFVAVNEHNELLGFGNCLPEIGLIDCLYVHVEHQSEGIGSLLLQTLENAIDSTISTLSVDASITARTFFERHGYTVRFVNTVHRVFSLDGKSRNAVLCNLHMQKSRCK